MFVEILFWMSLMIVEYADKIIMNKYIWTASLAECS